MDAPPKSPGTADGLMKKLKGFDGLAMSIGNGNADSNDGVTDPGLSQRFVKIFKPVKILSSIMFKCCGTLYSLKDSTS